MLRYLTSTLTACALAGTMSFAQEPMPQLRPPQPTPQQPEPAAPQPEAKPEAPKETLTGCVMEAKTTDGGKAYVLNKAKGGTAQMYVLSGSSETELASNVNKEVQVIGPVQQPPGPPPAADAKVLRPPSVQVESVKVINETCAKE